MRRGRIQTGREKMREEEKENKTMDKRKRKWMERSKIKSLIKGN